MAESVSFFPGFLNMTSGGKWNGNRGECVASEYLKILSAVTAFRFYLLLVFVATEMELLSCFTVLGMYLRLFFTQEVGFWSHRACKIEQQPLKSISLERIAQFMTTLLGGKCQVLYWCLLNTFYGIFEMEANSSGRKSKKTASEDWKPCWRGGDFYLEVNRHTLK